MAQRPPDSDDQYDDRGADTLTVVRPERKLKKPRMFRVLLHNDDYTTMEFVVYVLQTVFHRTEAESVQIMLHVHRSGVGVAGVYTKDVAETRVEEVHRLARENEFPLRCSAEEA